MISVRSAADESGKRSSGIACVTGASGVIGRRIVKRLLSGGWRVRAMTRGRGMLDERVLVFNGDLCDERSLKGFANDAAALFHCAAELEDESRMWDINVEGTRRIVYIAAESGIEYFCFVSSAGVVGNVIGTVVDETTDCHPYNLYEKSKWAAENIVARGIVGCRIVILRPTNVVAEEKMGVMNVFRGGFMNRLRLFIKGGECAHVVHADDVAAAAIYLMNRPTATQQCYYVSRDHELMNTYADIDRIYGACKNRTAYTDSPLRAHVPVRVAQIVRHLVRGMSNRGDVRYSSEKLLATGFVYKNGLEGAVRRIAESRVE